MAVWKRLLDMPPAEWPACSDEQKRGLRAILLTPSLSEAATIVEAVRVADRELCGREAA